MLLYRAQLRAVNALPLPVLADTAPPLYFPTGGQAGGLQRSDALPTVWALYYYLPWYVTLSHCTYTFPALLVPSCPPSLFPCPAVFPSSTLGCGLRFCRILVLRTPGIAFAACLAPHHYHFPPFCRGAFVSLRGYCYRGIFHAPPPLPPLQSHSILP